MSATLTQTWRKTVARNPDAIAVIDEASGRRWTRGELDREAMAWHGGVDGTQLAGRRVVLVEPNGIGWWRAFLSLLASEAVPAPLDGAEPPERQAAVARALGAGWICREGRLDPVPGVRLHPRRDHCLIKLTSGSTGLPHAVVFTHAQMLADGRQVATSMGIGPDDLNLAAIPCGHSYGLGNLVVPLLAQGTALVHAGSPLPQALAADCARWRPTVFPAVPALLGALVRAEIAPAALQSLRLVISAGAPLAAEVAAAFAEKFGRTVHGFYGASETGGICFDRTGDATLTGRSVGAPLDGVKLDFRRSRRFAVTSAAVTRSGRYSPPDLGRLNEFGELVLIGRAGRTLKIASRRVDLGEIERALRDIAGVDDAFAMAHPEKPDALAAVVSSQLPAGEIRRRLRTLVSSWKVPERLLTVAEFPRTARGKTDTRALSALLTRPAQGSMPKSK